AYRASTAGIGVDDAACSSCVGACSCRRTGIHFAGACARARKGGVQDPPKASPRLTDQQKIYVVRRLAAYDKARAIVEDLARDFGVTVTIKAIESYNPCLSTGRHLGKRWREMFAQARE